jgi:transposase
MEQAISEAKLKPDEVVTVFEDEASFYRQPTQGWLWSQQGRIQPKMHKAPRTDDCIREVAFMNVVNGQVLFGEYESVTVEAFKECITRLDQSYPWAKKINIIWDNLPNHWNNRLAQHIQTLPRLNIVGLPTYAPWLNYIEKLWRLVRQHVTHAHTWASEFETLKVALRQKLSEFANGSQDLLRYVGLLE